MSLSRTHLAPGSCLTKVICYDYIAESVMMHQMSASKVILYTVLAQEGARRKDRQNETCSSCLMCNAATHFVLFHKIPKVLISS